MASGNIEAGILIKASTEGDDKIAALAREVEGLAEGAGDAVPEFAALAEELANLAGQRALAGQFVEKALRWAGADGRFIFARAVNHPGYRGDAYLVEATREAIRRMPEIVQNALRER